MKTAITFRVFALFLIAGICWQGTSNAQTSSEQLVNSNFAVLQLLHAGRIAEALPYASQLPELIRREIGEDSFEYVFSLNNLGHIHLAMENFNSAAEAFTAGIPTTLKAVGRQHPAYLNLIVGLAAAERGKGNLPSAYQHAKEARQLLMQAPVQLQPVAAAALSEYFTISLLSNKLSEATETMHELMQLPLISEKEKPNLMVLAAKLEQKKGNLQAAAALYSEAKDLALRSRHPRTIENVLNECGLFQAELGKNESAIKLFEQSLQAAKASSGSESHVAMRIRLNLAMAQLAKRSLGEAFQLFETCLAAFSPESNPAEYARALAGIGTIQMLQGNLPAAVASLEKALEIYPAGGNSADLNRMSLEISAFTAWFNSGQPEKAMRGIQILIGELRQLTSISAYTIAEVQLAEADFLFKLGKSQEAKVRYQSILKMLEGKPVSEAHVITTFGLAVVQIDMGLLDDAQDSLAKSKSFIEQAPDLDSYLQIHRELVLADLLLHKGELKMAFDLYNSSIRSLVVNLNSMADAYVSALRGKAACLTLLGNNQEAERLLNVALSTMEGKYGWANIHTISTALQLAYLYHYRMQLQQPATELLETALDNLSTMKMKHTAKAADCLHLLANIMAENGNFQGALQSLKQSYSIYKNLSPHNSRQQIPVLNSMASIAIKMDLPGHAYSLLSQALKILPEQYPLPYEWALWGNFSTASEQLGFRTQATAFAKQAVQRLQAMRAQVDALGKDLTSQFLGQYESLYRDLIRLLLLEDRVLEAQEIVRLLKIEEAYQFNRGSSSPITTISLLRPEEEGALQDVRMFAADQNHQTNNILDNMFNPEAVATSVQQALDFAGNVERVIGRPLSNDSPHKDLQAEKIRQLLRNEAGGTVFLQYIVHPESLIILLHTTEQTYVELLPLERTLLTHKVHDFRSQLSSPFQSPENNSMALYDILIQPIERFLNEYKVENIFLSTDHILRYVPFSALMEGGKFLIERYAFSNLPTEGNGNWENTTRFPAFKGIGLGSTGEFKDLPDLPHVKNELTSIFKDDSMASSGFFPGKIILDRAFNRVALLSSLDEKETTLHIATHFKFNPSHASQSLLYLGGGASISLAELRDSTINTKWPHLLALSACETGLSATVSLASYGRDIEGFSQLASDRGVHSLLATLWQVADSGTAVFMKTLYEHLLNEVASSSLPHALRMAKLEISATKRFAHPFFWAGFTCTSPSFRPLKDAPHFPRATSR